MSQRSRESSSLSSDSRQHFPGQFSDEPPPTATNPPHDADLAGNVHEMLLRMTLLLTTTISSRLADFGKIKLPKHL